jgi:hypothetical protein
VLRLLCVSLVLDPLARPPPCLRSAWRSPLDLLDPRAQLVDFVLVVEWEPQGSELLQLSESLQLSLGTDSLGWQQELLVDRVLRRRRRRRRRLLARRLLSRA